jgi:hypothetical protein
MFEEIFFPRTAEKHRAAPLAEPRARYLRHLKEIGISRSTLRKCANDHLNLVRILLSREEDSIDPDLHAAAAGCFTGSGCGSGVAVARPSIRLIGMNWTVSVAPIATAAALRADRQL